MAPSNAPTTAANQGDLTVPRIIALGAVLPGLATLVVSLRFYSRMRSRNTRLGADDWLVLVSLIFTIGLGLMLIIDAALGGLERPPDGIGDTPPTDITQISRGLFITEKIFWSFNIVQCLAFGTAKLSVLFFYRRLFHGYVFDIVSISMIVTVITWTVGFFFSVVFRCGTRFWALWAPLEYLLEYCYSSTPAFLAFSISDVITDILILCIPIYWVSKLQMTPAKRIAIYGVFILGAAAIGAGIARLVVYVQQTKNFYLNSDGIGHLVTEMYWSMIEIGLSVICICLPTIRPLFGHRTPESVLKSANSKISLRSLSSPTIPNKSQTDQQTIQPTYEDIGLTP